MNHLSLICHEMFSFVFEVFMMEKSIKKLNTAVFVLKNTNTF